MPLYSSNMLISDFDFDLPSDLIAQEPLSERSASRMLVVDRGTDSFTDNCFSDIASFFAEGDLLVLNNTKVFPARLIGHTRTGARVEVFLVERIEGNVWKTLAKPARRLSPGKEISFSDRLVANVVERSDDGGVLVEFTTAGDIDAVIDEIGLTPLPPYIKRPDPELSHADRERYQTVFARERGAIAAPTAGLHFSESVFRSLAEKGVTTAELTLHVGYGTFEPVRVDDLSQHSVASERYEISSETADLLSETRNAGRRIVAVGTTTTRALEHCYARSGGFEPGPYVADLTIRPGYRFRAIDALLTNFHLPKSSLLVLTSSFGGHELIMRAYRHAVAQKYRFYSYGDCMLII